VITVDASGVNVSLSRVQRRVAWQRASLAAAEDLTLEATILRYNDAGVTLDIEQLPGFMPWSHWLLDDEEKTPAIIGTRLPVKYLECDPVKRRLIVSHRRALLDQLTRKGGALEPGQVARGTVSKVMPYGVAVQLQEGVRALLHVSQMSQTYVRNVDDLFSLGDPVTCVVLKVDASDGSVALSTKLLEDKPGEMLRDAKAVFERANERLPAASRS
jgi:small subunit ribosomal protein S1